MFRITFCILTACFFTCNSLIAQETKKKKLPDYREEYYVLKSQKSVKHGPYKKLSFKNFPILIGQFNQGSKSGIWQAFDQEGNLILKYDYDKKELLHYTPSKRNDFQFSLLDPKDYNVASLVKPIILDGEPAFFQNLAENIRYPIEALRKGITGKVFVSFVVEASGAVSNYSLLGDSDIDPLLKEEALRVIKTINSQWLPATINGVPIDVVVTLPVSFATL